MPHHPPPLRAMMGSSPSYTPPARIPLARNSLCLCGSDASVTQNDRFAEHEICCPSPRDFSGERVAEGRVRGCATCRRSSKLSVEARRRDPSGVDETFRYSTGGRPHGVHRLHAVTPSASVSFLSRGASPSLASNDNAETSACSCHPDRREGSGGWVALSRASHRPPAHPDPSLRSG
jgi:hypothetical protein